MASLAVFLKREFPRRVLFARCRIGMNQRELAEAAGISPSTINEIEGGFSADLRTSTLLKLCRVLAVTPNYLLGFD